MITFLDPGHHSLYQLSGVECCGFFKGRIIHLGTVICLVGDSTMMTKGMSFKYAPWAMEAPSISAQAP